MNGIDRRQALADDIERLFPDSTADAWIVPGDDNANMGGFLDARVLEEGEFSKPLFSRDTILAALRATGSEGVGAAEMRERPLSAFLGEATAAVESDSVLSICAAREWQELDHDVRAWVCAIVRETLARRRDPPITTERDDG